MGSLPAKPPDMELLDMVMENISFAVRNTRPSPTRSPLSPPPSPLRSTLLTPSPSRSVSPRPSKSPKLSAEMILNRSASMLPSSRTPPTLWTRPRLLLESPPVTKSPLPSPPSPALMPSPLMEDITDNFFIKNFGRTDDAYYL